MKIMVVDDEKIQLESLRRGLKRKGYSVVEALNGKEALQQLNRDSDIDLVITDYAMPGINGIELLKKIRKNHISLPVIMMTAYGEKDLIIEALRNHCDSFIEKPFSLDQLINEIKRAELYMIRNTNSHQLSNLFPKFVHQLNNPLMAILGNAEMSMFSLEDNDNEAIKKNLTGIVEAIETIRGINREILQLGQATEDKIEAVDIKETLNECVKMFEGLIALKDVSVEKNLNGDHLYVSGNRFGLEQLFKNLIINATDSMDGSPEKRLKVRTEIDRTASSVSVYIEDTGCGIPKESMDKIFTSYFTSKKNGTGLGLPVVKSIVEKHRGKIEVESEVGKGTRFRVMLPIGN